MSEVKFKLAELLLRRKELALKVQQLYQFKTSDLFQTKVKRVNVTESIDDVTATVPKLTAGQVTAEYDWYARQLRLVDAAIQRANWTTEVEVGGDVMDAYRQPDKK